MTRIDIIMHANRRLTCIDMWLIERGYLVDQMKTPILIMIGAKDLRVPPSQGHQLARALESRGKKVK